MRALHRLLNVINGDSRLPDASIDADLMASDLQQLKERGAGGVELHNYFGSPKVCVQVSRVNGLY